MHEKNMYFDYQRNCTPSKNEKKRKIQGGTITLVIEVYDFLIKGDTGGVFGHPQSSKLIFSKSIQDNETKIDLVRL